MKYYIISGEASGDMHGANLMKELKKLDAEASFRVWGGELMQREGATLVKHYKHHSFIGLFILLKNLKTIRNNFRLCRHDLKEYQPDFLILIDYSGFNLPMAKFAKSIGLRVFYYISPQLWAWRQYRVKKIKKYVDRMFVILPFEKDFYNTFDYPVEYVGHPLIDAIEHKKNSMVTNEAFAQKYGLSAKPVIAILPGSRKQEILEKLPVMLSVTEYFPDHEFIIAATESIKPTFYQHIIGNKKVHFIVNETYQILQIAHAAMVTSGTATLETALFHVPQVVCYRGGNLSYFIVKMMVKIKFIALVNLIMGKEVVKELIQFDLNTENLKTELTKVVYDSEYRINILNDYKELAGKLGGIGASRKAAEKMVGL